jgi:hypothetical protein
MDGAVASRLLLSICRERVIGPLEAAGFQLTEFVILGNGRRPVRPGKSSEMQAKGRGYGLEKELRTGLTRTLNYENESRNRA